MGTSGTMLTASASGSRGKGDGSGVSYTNTHVTAADKLTISAGGDTSIKGATAEGKQVTASIGGNLVIESLQDSSSYHSKQEGYGGRGSNQHFSHPGLAAAMAVGGPVGMYSTAMFGLAGVQHALGK